MSNISVFPSGVTVYNKEKAFSGYTLFGAGIGAVLIDMNGRVRKVWEGLNKSPVKPLPGGRIIGSTGTAFGFGGIEDYVKTLQLDWEGNTEWTNPEFNGVIINSAQNNVETAYVDFVGITSPVSFTANDRTVLYLGADDKLYYPGKDMTLNACRAYFQLKGISAGDIAETRLYFGEDDETGLTPLSSPDGKEMWYDLQGRKLERMPTVKGIYINNGKKVVIQ